MFKLLIVRAVSRTGLLVVPGMTTSSTERGTRPVDQFAPLPKLVSMAPIHVADCEVCGKVQLVLLPKSVPFVSTTVRPAEALEYCTCTQLTMLVAVLFKYQLAEAVDFRTTG